MSASKKYRVKTGHILHLPTVEEQLKCLDPSPELLLYYQSKLKSHENDLNLLLDEVKKCKAMCEKDIVGKAELVKRDNELFRLQKSLSDLQVYLEKERSYSLKLRFENDNLRIQKARDRKVIQFLLRLCGTSEKKVYYLMNKSHRVGPMFQQQETAEVDDPPSIISGGDQDPEVLTLKVKALTCQLHELTKSSTEEIYSLHQDRELIQLEKEKNHEEYQKRIKSLTERLNETQVSLCESTKALVELKKEVNKKEESWVLEKEEFKKMKYFLQNNCNEAITYIGDKKRKDVALEGLREQLHKKDRLLKLYKDQCASLEKELKDLRNQKDAAYAVLQGKMEKISKQLCIIKEKYKTVVRQKALEAEGFRNDVKIQRDRINNLDRRLSNFIRGVIVPQRKEILDSEAHLARKKALERKLLQADLKLKQLDSRYCLEPDSPS